MEWLCKALRDAWDVLFLESPGSLIRIKPCSRCSSEDLSFATQLLACPGVRAMRRLLALLRCAGALERAGPVQQTTRIIT